MEIVSINNKIDFVLYMFICNGKVMDLVQFRRVSSFNNYKKHARYSEVQFAWLIDKEKILYAVRKRKILNLALSYNYTSFALGKF